MENPIKIYTSNRGFLYGDGFFETLRIKNGMSVLWEYHLARIKAACEAFDFQLHPNLGSELLSFIKSEVAENNCRLRINFYRSGDGKYTPNQNNISISYATEPLTETEEMEYYWAQLPKVKNWEELNLLTARLNIQNAQITSCNKPLFPLASFKLLSAPWYVLAGLQSKQTPDALPILLNQEELISESLTGNLLMKDPSGSWFLVDHPTAIQGVHQQFLHQKLQIPFIKDVTPLALKNAIEIFNINALGIQRLILSNQDYTG